MDPASIISIISIASSAIRLYDNVYGFFRRCNKVSADVEHLQRQIHTQNAAFRNECRLVLTCLSDSELAKEMIGDREHPAWVAPEVYARHSNQALRSSSKYTQIMRSIAGKLIVMERELVRLHIILDQLPNSRSMTDKVWRRKVRRKYKATSLTNGLHFHLNDLHKLVAEYLALSSSTEESKWRLDKMDPPKSLELEQRLGELRFVRKAALQLHHALAQACLAHEHSGYFSLEPDHVSVQNTGPSSVSFSIAFTGCSVDMDPAGTNTNLLAIKSAFYEPRTTISVEQDPMINNPVSAFTKAFATANDVLHTSIVVHNLKTTQWVRFRTDPATRTPALGIPDQPLEEFSSGHEFCFYKRSLILRSKGDLCIGYLEMAEETGTWRHLLYVIPRAATTASQPTEASSLAQFYYAVSRGNGHLHLSIHARFQLAHKIARAVLSLYSTPWLSSSWKSDDILLFSSLDSFKQRNMPMALTYLKFRSLNRHQEKKDVAKACESAPDEFPFDSSIFNLGVLLLELAYLKPLSSFRDGPESSSYEGEKIADFVLAQRLSLTLGREMGATYARVVQKCLSCDFGKRNSLYNRATEAIFYQDVVCELERLEECCRELEIQD